MDAKKIGLVKPDYAADRDNERKLQHIATRGVTQLFNAVAERQAYLERKVGQMVGQPRKERKRIVEELKEYDFGAELGRAEAKRRKRTEEAEVKKEEPEAEDDDDADDEVAEVSGYSSMSDANVIDDESSDDDDDSTDIEIKEEPQN